MIHEHLSAHCDICVAENPDQHEQLKRAFGYDPSTLEPAYFDNHTVLARTLRQAGWYVGAQQLLCPEHYRALLAKHQINAAVPDD